LKIPTDHTQIVRAFVMMCDGVQGASVSEDGIVQIKPLAGSAPDTPKILKDTNAWIKQRGWNYQVRVDGALPSTGALVTVRLPGKGLVTMPIGEYREHRRGC